MERIELDEVLSSPHKYKMTSDDTEIVYVMDKVTREVFKLTHKQYELLDYILDFMSIDYEYDDDDVMDVIYKDC